MKEIKKLIIAFGLVVLLLSLAVPVGFAQEEGPVSGSFTAANVTPTVTALEIYSDAGLTTVAADLTPQVMYYYVKVTAGDFNTIDDIDEIEVQLFYDAASSDPVAPGVANTQTCAIFTWTKVGDAWAASAGAGTTWAIASSSSSRPAIMTTSSGDWVFAITAGKVATESPGADNWDVYAKATDGGGNGTAYTRDKEMLWYGEISTSATADFGSVTPGSGFADDTNEVGSISVNYTANGNYDQKVKSDVAWGGTTYTADYDATGACDDPQEFSLLAYDADAFGSALQVDTSGISIDATGTQTGESGNTVASNTLWLKVASVFNIDTYSGNVTYIVENR
jgi:hypothetical protein